MAALPPSPFNPPRHLALALALGALTLAGTPARASAPELPGTAHPALWPRHHYPVRVSAATARRVNALLRRMTLEEKVGQVLQGDIDSTTPDDVRRYHLGSVLNGGNSGPGGDDFAPAPAWLKLADQYWAASTDRSHGGAGVPVMWGIDAVHGHSNIIGATLFPHNVALGATRDPAMIEAIGAATAREIRVTGQEWTFAPTVTVPQDWRWGRAYEGYSSDPALVARLTGAMVRGLQGPPGQTNLLARDKVLASTKHFLGDGATTRGIDQGDAAISETALRDIHGRPYGPAINNGVATVMASFSSWQGVKMTGNASLLTGVLKQRMGFGGFVVSDWNAHASVPGCTANACAKALAAGIDMLMAPDSWKGLYADLLSAVHQGRLSPARLDDAVRRILTVKARLGLLDAPRPSARPLAGQWDVLGAPAHRALARRAVRESLVLLKNQGVLPLRAGGHLLVAGDGADDVARQAGGWTLSWQGTGTTPGQFPGATTIWAGLRDAVTRAGGSAELAPDGHYRQHPDAAVVVFGEKPYAEFQGDIPSLQLDPALTAPWATLQRLRAEHIPVVAVMLTGRPLWVNPALNAADAFVVAWLPGSEGEGLADVLVGDAKGHARHDFVGRLPVAWPRTAQASDGALFGRGFGLDYRHPTEAWAPLPEDAGVAASTDTRLWFGDGRTAAGWQWASGPTLRVSATDWHVQEGARRLQLAAGNATLTLTAPTALDLTRQMNGEVLLLVTAKVATAPAAAHIAMRCGPDATCGGGVAVTLPANPNFVRYGVPLKCLATHGVAMDKVTVPFALTLTGPADLTLGEVRLGSDAEVVLPCPQ